MSVPPHISQNHGAYGGRGPEVMGVAWSLGLVTTVIIVVRTYVRCFMLKGTKRFGGLTGAWALFWAYVAWLVGMAANCFLTVSVHYGMGNHLEVVMTEGDIIKASLWNWIWATAIALQIGLSKLTVVAFLIDIQGPTHKYQKWFLIFLALSSIVTNLVAAIYFIWFQCTPSEKLWNPFIEGDCPLTEINWKYATFAGAYGSAIDLYLALYPVVLVSRLQIARRLKFILATLMGLGVFTAACSAVKTYELKHIKSSTDPTYDGASLSVWAVAECWVTLIASGIPATWPLIKLMLKKASVAFPESGRFSSIALRSLFSFSSSHSSLKRGQPQTQESKGSNLRPQDSVSKLRKSSSTSMNSQSSTININDAAIADGKIAVTREVTVSRESNEGSSDAEKAARIAPTMRDW